jgi:hypothetical protein
MQSNSGWSPDWWGAEDIALCLSEGSHEGFWPLVVAREARCHKPLDPQLQFVILLGGRPFFDFVEGDSHSSAVYLEQVEHRLRLFAPQVPRVGF